MKPLFAFSGLLASFLLSACSPELPHDKHVVTIMGHHHNIELACSSGSKLGALIVVIEYRRWPQQKLFAVAYDGNEKVIGELAISPKESCSFGNIAAGNISGGERSKYYRVEHTWVALTSQLTPLCINGLSSSACSQAAVVLELRSNPERKLQTQAVYVLLDEQQKVVGTYIVPKDVEQHFTNFYNRTS